MIRWKYLTASRISKPKVRKSSRSGSHLSIQIPSFKARALIKRSLQNPCINPLPEITVQNFSYFFSMF